MLTPKWRSSVPVSTVSNTKQSLKFTSMSTNDWFRPKKLILTSHKERKEKTFGALDGISLLTAYVKKQMSYCFQHSTMCHD